MGDVDDLPIESRGTLAGSVEGSLKRSHGSFEGTGRAVIGLVGLSHRLLGHGAHGLRDGGVETQETELGRHIAVRIARLVGGRLGIVGSSHGSASQSYSVAIALRQGPRGSRSQTTLDPAWPRATGARLENSEKGACTKSAR